MDGSMQMNMNGMMVGCMTIAVIFFLTIIATSIIQTIVQIKILTAIRKKKKS